MPEERLTEELLERLLASSRPGDFLSEPGVVDRTLPTYLFELLDAKGLRRSVVARESGLNPTFVYDVFAGKSRLGRDHAIMLSLGLGCTLRETQRVLRLDGVAELWPKIRRDAIIIWCVDHGFSRPEVDDCLWEFGEKTLLGTEILTPSSAQ